MDKIILTTETELMEIISKAIKEELSTLKLKETTNENELITRNEVCDLLSITLPTLHNWTKKNKLVSYNIENSVRYKKHEVLKSLVKNKHFNK